MPLVFARKQRKVAGQALSKRSRLEILCSAFAPLTGQRSKSLKTGCLLSHSMDAIDAKFCIFNRRSISQAGRRGFDPRPPLHLFINLKKLATARRIPARWSGTVSVAPCGYGAFSHSVMTDQCWKGPKVTFRGLNHISAAEI